VALCNEKAHDRVPLLDARDWSEKRCVNRSIFSSGHLRQLLQKVLFFVAAA
jgi:hypothetical protein